MSRVRALVFHHALGFVHQSIPDAVAAIVAMGQDHNFQVATTADPRAFTTANLDRFDVVMLVHTSGNVLSEPETRVALERFVRTGGGVVAVHAAASMGPQVLDEWPWYRALIGAAFTGHTDACVYCDNALEDGPGIRYGGLWADAPDDAEIVADRVAMTTWETAVVHVEANAHWPECHVGAGLIDGATRSDEWYGFDANPRANVQVVATVDETTYRPGLGTMGSDHPILWWHDFDGGRCVYNAMGHARATWSDPAFLDSVLGGILWAAQHRMPVVGGTHREP